MEPVEGQRNEFHQPYPHGIGCERCHGPGQLHVDRWSTGDEEPRGEPDWTIVNPRRLERRQRVEICFQCHLGDAKATIRVARHDRDMRDYRPGQPIADYVVPFFYAQPTHWEFGLSSQADRMMQSRCYTESGGRMECLTCHNPHMPVYESTVDEFYKQKCLNCHSLEDCGLEHVDPRRAEMKDDCVACHMRRAEPDDQRFTEFTDHWIRRDIELERRDHREDYSVVAAFPDQLSSYPAGEQAYYRGRANFLLAMDAPESRRPPMWDEAERWFVEAIEQGFDNASSQFFLAKSRAYRGDPVGALEAFKRAVEHDPAHHDANLALGQTLFQAGNLDAAAAAFRGMLERDPDDPMALAEYARVAWTQKRYEEALHFYQRAAEQEPWNPTLQLNVGMSLASLQRFAEAAEVGSLATALDPDNSKTWNLYFNAMREAGRGDRAYEGQRQFERMQTVEDGAE
jgi:predicted CXXCH cytochrome family protein